MKIENEIRILCYSFDIVNLPILLRLTCKRHTPRVTIMTVGGIIERWGPMGYPQIIEDIHQKRVMELQPKLSLPLFHVVIMELVSLLDVKLSAITHFSISKSEENSVTSRLELIILGICCGNGALTL